MNFFIAHRGRTQRVWGVAKGRYINVLNNNNKKAQLTQRERATAVHV